MQILGLLSATTDQEAVVFDGIPIDLGGIGVVGVILILGWMLATGRLYTRGQYEQTVHDRDEWRGESRIKDQQILERDEQLRHLSEVGRTVEAIMRSIHTLSIDSGGGREGKP